MNSPEKYNWERDTTQQMRKLGGRDLEDYKENLGFDEKDLEGKTVLDLGSGSLEKLSRELKKKGIDANVVSLNPDYVLEKYRKIIANQKDWQKKSAAGIAQELPFRDDTFDKIFSLEAVTFYMDALHESKDAEAWAKEVVRVLKPGGEARLGEILGMKGEAKQEAWQKIIDMIKASGADAKIEAYTVKEPIARPRYRLIIKKLI
jgi:ubiquinone/menaquinone biosynthesis C-methylase UbiE